jgi:hypothetical protein
VNRHGHLGAHSAIVQRGASGEEFLFTPFIFICSVTLKGVYEVD